MLSLLTEDMVEVVEDAEETTDAETAEANAQPQSAASHDARQREGKDDRGAMTDDGLRGRALCAQLLLQQHHRLRQPEHSALNRVTRCLDERSRT